MIVRASAVSTEPRRYGQRRGRSRVTQILLSCEFSVLSYSYLERLLALAGVCVPVAQGLVRGARDDSRAVWRPVQLENSLQSVHKRRKYHLSLLYGTSYHTRSSMHRVVLSTCNCSIQRRRRRRLEVVGNAAKSTSKSRSKSRCCTSIRQTKVTCTAYEKTPHCRNCHVPYTWHTLCK